jgi:flagellar assembly protein FliH
MSNAKKFTFDMIFDEKGQILQEPPKPQRRSYLPKEVDEIRAEALQEGKRSAEAMADQAVALSLKQMSAVVESLFNILDQEVETIRTEAAQLALAIGTKVAGTLMEAAPTQVIEDLIDDCLSNLRSEPHVHIQVHPDHAEVIQTRLNETISGRTFEGKLHIDPSDGLSQTDVRIEWANGGIEKSPQDLIRSITEIIEQKWNIKTQPVDLPFQDNATSTDPLADIA